MLPYYVESILLQQRNYLSLLHNIGRILRHILERCLKACLKLRNAWKHPAASLLHKVSILKEFNESLTSKSFLNP